MLTVKEAVESKGDQRWEPDVGKRLKGEVHPLALAIAIVFWIFLYHLLPGEGVFDISSFQHFSKIWISISKRGFTNIFVKH